MKYYPSVIERQQNAVKKYAKRRFCSVQKSGQAEWVTYEEFGKQVNQVRRSLDEMGVSEGSIVGIVAPNGIEWAVFAYAVYGLQAVLVTMFPKQRQEELEFILNNAQPSVIFADNSVYPFILSQTQKVSFPLKIITSSKVDETLCFQDLLNQGVSNPMEAIMPKPNQLMTITYTSGTSNDPKGVCLSHQNIASNVDNLLGVIPATCHDRTMPLLPWSHCLGQVIELHSIIACGGSLYIGSVATFAEDLQKSELTILVGVPRLFNQIYQNVLEKISQSILLKGLFKLGMNAVKSNHQMTEKLCYWILFRKIKNKLGKKLIFAACGGAALNQEIEVFFDALRVPLVQGYGLSETSPLVSVNSLNSKRYGSVGKVLDSVKVEFLEDSEDEIVVRGPNVMQGYYQHPEGTKEVLQQDGSLRTGDCGYLDEDGFLFITGRVKEFYKLDNGKWISPAILEESLLISPLIKQVMVYGENQPYNVALIVAEGQIDNDELQKLIQSEIDLHSKNFPKYEQIKKFAIVQEEWTIENGLITSTLKLKRNLIRNHHQSTLDALY